MMARSCQRCGGALNKRGRIADENGIGGREFKCRDCGAGGAILDSRKAVGPAVDADASSAPLAIADGGEQS